jgi:3-oxoadipate enol-lactonase
MKRGGLSGNATGAAGNTGGAPGAAGASPATLSLEAAYPLELQQAHPDRIARFRAIQAASDQASFAASVPAAYNVAFAEVLPHIQCPALIIATARWIRPVSSFKELADAIPHGEFTVIDTGHFAAMESPELLIPVLEQFLDKHGSRGQ